MPINRSSSNEPEKIGLSGQDYSRPLAPNSCLYYCMFEQVFNDFYCFSHQYVE